MQDTLVEQIREFLRPYGMFLVPDGPAESIPTKRGGQVYLTETQQALHTRIVRRDGTTFTDERPLDDPGKLAIAVRALVFRARA
jgi:hypothetical protein